MISCPSCHTPITEPISYARGGLLVRLRTIKIYRIADNQFEAVITCKQCGAAMKMDSEFSRKAFELFESMQLGKSVIEVSTLIGSQLISHKK